jgi:hypothetical protein
VGKLYIFDNGVGKGEEFVFQEISKEKKIEEKSKKEGSPWRDEKKRDRWGEVWRNKHFVPKKLKQRTKLK